MANNDILESRIKEKLLEALRFFKDFCAKNNLKWWAAYGTALGCAREKGFIPWDDDIDLWMPRADYERFLSMSSALSGSNYSIVQPFNEGYYLPFAKLIDTSTTIWEMKRHPFLLGVYIDIFPLDYFATTPDNLGKILTENYRLSIEYRRHLAEYSPYDLMQLLTRREFSAFVWYFIDRIGNLAGAKKRMKDKLLKRQLMYSKQDPATATLCSCFLSEVTAGLDPAWFEDTIYLPFEDMTIPMPKGFDPMLTRLYGDWHKRPDVSEQLSTHYRHYINLCERLDLQTVKARMRAGETVKY